MQPFRDLCDTTLRHAGALRIDHVMSLERLYWIPETAPATAGAYVRYPMRHLLAKLTAASRRHRAIVVGEYLGVVPTGVRSKIGSAHVSTPVTNAHVVFGFIIEKNTHKTHHNMNT